MTEAELKAIRERWEAATAGPWEVRRGGNFTDFGMRGFNDFCEKNSHSATELKLGSTRVGFNVEADLGRSQDDAEFIAHAITDVPALLAEVERLRAAMRHAVNEMRWVPELARPCVGNTNVACLEAAIKNCRQALGDEDLSHD